MLSDSCIRPGLQCIRANKEFRKVCGIVVETTKLSFCMRNFIPFFKILLDGKIKFTGTSSFLIKSWSLTFYLIKKYSWDLNKGRSNDISPLDHATYLLLGIFFAHHFILYKTYFYVDHFLCLMPQKLIRNLFCTKHLKQCMWFYTCS